MAVEARIGAASAGGPARDAGAGTNVDIVGVSAWYGTSPALLDVTMHAPCRSITALIGPSGCGKTTLLRSINRLNDLVPGYRLTGSIAVGDAEVYDGLCRWSSRACAWA